MKKTLLFIVAVAIGLYSNAQENTSGKVIYEQLIKLEIKLEGDASQFAHLLPKERKSNKVLYFNSEASLYENAGEMEDESMSMNSEGANVMIKMQEPENKVFTELKSNKQIEQREFMTRTFLIEGEVSNQWKITGNQKMILDYPCQEATMEKDSNLVTAWFTPVIPVSAGPASYCGLPGMVLAIESNGGKSKIQATSVDFSSLEKDILVKPKKGKKVTREEFDVVVEEKMKEMGAEQGSGGHQMMIRIQK